MEAALAAQGEVIERATKAVLAMHICLPGRVCTAWPGPASQGPKASMVPGRAQETASLKAWLKSSLTHVYSHAMFISDTHKQKLLGYSEALQAPLDALAHPPGSKGCSSYHKLCSHNITQDT